MTEADLLRQWHEAIAATPHVRLEKFSWNTVCSGPECIRWQDADDVDDTHVAIAGVADANTLTMRLDPRPQRPGVTRIYLREPAPAYNSDQPFHSGPRRILPGDALQPFRPPAEVWAEMLRRVADTRLLSSAATPP